MFLKKFQWINVKPAMLIQLASMYLWKGSINKLESSALQYLDSKHWTDAVHGLTSCVIVAVLGKYAMVDIAADWHLGKQSPSMGSSRTKHSEHGWQAK